MTGSLLAQKYLFSIETIVFGLLTLWLWLYFRGFGRQYVKYWMYSLLALTLNYLSMSLIEFFTQLPLKSTFQLFLRTIEQLSKYSFLLLFFVGAHNAIKNTNISSKRFLFFPSLFYL